MWSFPERPPSNRFSVGALAIVPAMFVAFLVLQLTGLGNVIVGLIVQLVKWMGL